MSRLEVAVASAGAGKTYDLCETVHEAVKNGLDPSRILATTFTKKAAAELRGRLQARILEAGGADGTLVIQQAEKLEFAAIGTVHGVALQLVRKFALHLGLSPRLQVLPEGSERDNLQHLFIGFGDEMWQAIGPLMERLDLREEQLRETLFRLVELKRNSGIGEEAFRKQMIAGRDRLIELLGPVTEPTAPIEAVRETLQATLAKIESLTGDTTKETKNGIYLIKEFLSKSSAKWSDYPKTSRLKAGKKSGADQLMETPRALAQAVRGYGAFHADVEALYTQITEMALKLDSQYSTFKQTNCYADYTDLLFLLLNLLEKPEMEVRLMSEFDLVLVDEVQDSQPVEYAIFERLRRLSNRSRWVGDPNQAIYSFKGADPGLLNKYLDDKNVDASVYSRTNRRSQAGLVQLFGKVFQGNLGPQVVQIPHHPAESKGIERWLFDSTNEESDLLACVTGVQTLMAEGIAPGDIAILARENKDVNQLAETFRRFGIPTLSASAGLLAQRECALVVSAMRLVADHSDTLAAANILHHVSDPDESVPSWAMEWPLDPAKPPGIGEIMSKLGGEIGAQVNGGDIDEGQGPGTKTLPLARMLKAITDIDASNLSPYMVTVQVMRVLAIQQGIGQWTEPGQRAGCLDSLLQLARTYEEQSLAKGAPATLSGLVLHLEELRREGGDMIHPVPGGNAIHVLTFHKAKGLEWPVVILTDLNYREKTKPWNPKLAGSGDINNPFAGRDLRYWQWPLGYDNSAYPQPLKGSDLEIDMQNSEEIQQELAQLNQESIRLLFVGFTRAKRKLVLTHRKDKTSATGQSQSYHSWLDELPEISEILSKDLEPGKEHDLKAHGIETTFLVRVVHPAPVSQTTGDSRWPAFNPTLGENGEAGIQRYHSPSKADGDVSHAKAEAQTLAGKQIFPAALETENFPILGQAVHAFLGAIPSLAGCDDKIWVKRASDCLASFGMSGFLSAYDLVLTAKAFREWVSNQYLGAKWHVEVPLSSPRSAGGQWTGTADLILELPGGELVLVDHKSSPIRKEYCEKKAVSYFGQLTAYKEILETFGYQVKDIYIHFPLACQIVNIRKN